MTRLGMDVDDVEHVGRALRNQARHLDGLALAVDHLVRDASQVWDGRDSRQFLEWWVSDHRPVIVAAGRAIEQLGLGALDHARRQRETSGH